ncbi:hypothetical protein [Paenibacillus popilliae]|uniref:hypothetical protein n=1 Tax=Paenibacillus popilliae TaxID=78057 RepID=UPI0002F3A737|nr:hypothetical protein [Paenibacillus popilliae]
MDAAGRLNISYMRTSSRIVKNAFVKLWNVQLSPGNQRIGGIGYMRPIRISFSTDRFDQWRLSQVGGRITNHRGKEMFIFDSERQWQRYLELNKERNKAN